MEDDEDECYMMSSIPRGKDSLTKTFENLHFLVQSHQHLCKEDFLKILQNVSDIDHTNYDCIAVFIVAHGDHNVIITADNRDLRIDSILDYLKPMNCPTLTDKPKLIFIEACRGDQPQEALETVDYVDSASVPRSRYFSNEDDFLIGFSTILSFVSYNGWYRKLVADTLAERAKRDHIVDMMTVVNRKMSELEHITDRGSITLQTSEIVSRLKKKVYFRCSCPTCLSMVVPTVKQQ